MVKSWDAEMLAFCRSEQAKILEACAPMLKAGGMLLYSTCTFSPEENEKSIASSEFNRKTNQNLHQADRKQVLSANKIKK